MTNDTHDRAWYLHLAVLAESDFIQASIIIHFFHTIELLARNLEDVKCEGFDRG